MIDKEQFKKDFRKIINQGNQFVDAAEAYIKKYKAHRKELESLKDDELKELFKEAEELSEKLNYL